MSAPPVPEKLEQALDHDWLTRALAPISGGAEVTSVEMVEKIRTMASKVRIAVRFANDPDREHNYCLKAFLDNESDPGMGGSTTIREADFYTEIAPRTTMRVPGIKGAVIDRERERAILIMNDLVKEGARFCSALEAFSPDEAAQSVEQIARLHAAEEVVDDIPWLPSRLAQLVMDSGYYTPTTVQPLLDDPRSETLDAKTKDASVLFAGMAKLAERTASGPQVLLHGDCHAGNIYWTTDGPGFTDWQLIQRGNWALDVAYHICAILPVDVAEREERRLLDHYLDKVRALGGHPPDRETAWEDYRAAQIYGFFQWAITRMVDPPIIKIFTERLGAGVMRHDSYRLLGV